MINNSNQQPIRGPEWSGAQVTRNSLRVEPLTKLQEHQLRNEQFRLRTEQTKQQIQRMFHTLVHSSKPKRQDSLQERCDYSGRSNTSQNSEDFRKIQKELKAKGFTSATNKTILLPVVDCHRQARDSHRSRNQLMRSLNAKSA